MIYKRLKIINKISFKRIQTPKDTTVKICITHCPRGDREKDTLCRLCDRIPHKWSQKCQYVLGCCVKEKHIRKI